MDKSVKKKDDSTGFPTLAPKTMDVGPERPRESLEEEGGGERPRISDATIRRRNGQKPSNPIPEKLRPHETEEMEDGIEESWHDASEEGCEVACEEVKEGIRKRPNRAPNFAAFRIECG